MCRLPTDSRTFSHRNVLRRRCACRPSGSARRTPRAAQSGLAGARSFCTLTPQSAHSCVYAAGEHKLCRGRLQDAERDRLDNRLGNIGGLHPRQELEQEPQEHHSQSLSVCLSPPSFSLRARWMGEPLATDLLPGPQARRGWATFSARSCRGLSRRSTSGQRGHLRSTRCRTAKQLREARARGLSQSSTGCESHVARHCPLAVSHSLHLHHSWQYFHRSAAYACAAHAAFPDVFTATTATSSRHKKAAPPFSLPIFFSKPTLQDTFCSLRLELEPIVISAVDRDNVRLSFSLPCCCCFLCAKPLGSKLTVCINLEAVVKLMDPLALFAPSVRTCLRSSPRSGSAPSVTDGGSRHDSTRAGRTG